MKFKEKWTILTVILIIILAIICSFKQDKKEVKSDNPYQKYNFYKEENYNRYLNYQNKTNLNEKDTILYVNIGLDNDFYTNAKESPKQNTNYVLVNKYNYLLEKYIPNNLIKLDEYAKNNLYLNQEAYNAFKKMALDAKINGLSIRIISAYRDYNYQNNLYNNYLKNDPQNADKYSAKPGHSEHQTGLAIDIDNISNIYDKFENTKEFLWVKDNCYKYGFILRYPKDKEHITGYIYEPWHYRYVGIEISSYIYENDLTYEEYYYEFLY